MGFWHFYRLLRKQRLFVVGLVAACLLAAVVVMYVYPVYPKPQYTSTARLLITPPGYQVTQLSTEQRPWYFGVNQDEVFSATIAELVKSETVRSRAKDELGRTPSSRAIDRTLEVSPVKAPTKGVEMFTHVVEVSSRARTPQDARRNTAAVVDAFLGFYAEATRAQARYERGLISGQVEPAKARYDKAQAAVRDYKTKNGFADLTRTVSTLSDRYFSVWNELQDIESGLVKGTSARRKALTTLSDETMERIRTLPASEARLAELEIERRVAEQTYELLSAKLIEADMAESINAAAGQVSVVDRAGLPERAIGTYKPSGLLDFVPAFDYRKLLVLFTVLVLSAGTAVAWVVVVDRVDNRVRSGEDAVRATALPLLGVIPDAVDAGHADGDLTDVRRESFHALQARIVHDLAARGSSVIAVVGAGMGEGRTRTVADLGASLAEAGLRVALVDADLRGRGLTRLLKGKGPDVEEAVFGDLPAASVLAPTGTAGLSIVPAPDVPERTPVELLGSARFAGLLEALSAEVDVVLVDTPPVLAFADAAFVAAKADTCLFVLRAGTPDRGAFQFALDQLEEVSSVLGVVLVGADEEHCEALFHHLRYLQAGRMPAGRRVERGPVVRTPAEESASK